MNVVSHMDVLAVAHLAQEGYKWVPKRSTYSVTTRKDVGWPTVGPKVKDEGTISHGELFAANACGLEPFQYDQIPSMNALEDYVSGPRRCSTGSTTSWRNRSATAPSSPK